MSDEGQLKLFPVAVHLHRIDPDPSMHHFYRLALQPDLFSGCTLAREWEHIGSEGRLRIDIYDYEGQAVDALAVPARGRTRRGYAPHGCSE